VQSGCPHCPATAWSAWLDSLVNRIEKIKCASYPTTYHYTPSNYRRPRLLPAQPEPARALGTLQRQHLRYSFEVLKYTLSVARCFLALCSSGSRWTSEHYVIRPGASAWTSLPIRAWMGPPN